MPQDYLAWWLLAVPSPPGRAAAPVSTVLPAAMGPWPVHRTCYLSQTCCFQLSRDSRSGRDTLHDRLWKAKWHLLLRCWLAAPSTTTVIIIIWPCWSFMNIWTPWPCSVIISTRHSQKRTGHPTYPGSSLGFFLGFSLSREFFLATVLLHLHCLLFKVLGWLSVQHFKISADVQRAI